MSFVKGACVGMVVGISAAMMMDPRVKKKVMKSSAGKAIKSAVNTMSSVKF